MKWNDRRKCDNDSLDSNGDGTGNDSGDDDKGNVEQTTYVIIYALYS